MNVLSKETIIAPDGQEHECIKMVIDSPNEPFVFKKMLSIEEQYCAHFYVKASTNSHVKISGNVIDIGTSWAYRSIVFTPNIEDMQMYLDIGTYYFDRFMVERGNRDTDYQRAPEDTVEEIGMAMKTANGKNTVFYQDFQPPSENRKINDVWFDTGNDNAMYFWNGTKWEEQLFGTNAIAELSITNALIADATIKDAKIANLDAAKITTGFLNADRIAADAITADKIAAGAVETDKLAANAVTAVNIAADAVTAEKILAKTITADKIAAGTITATQMHSDSITSDKIVADAITTAKIATSAVTANEIAANAITADKIIAGAVNANKIEAGAIKTAHIEAGAVKTAQIDAGAVTADKIEANAITANEIAVETITAKQMATDSITSDKIAANAITADKISANAITSDKILAGAVTADKIAIGDFTNYANLSDDTCNDYGFSKADNNYFQADKPKSHCISKRYYVNGGEKFYLSADIICSVVSTDAQWMGTGLTLYCYDINGTLVHWKGTEYVTYNNRVGRVVTKTVALPDDVRSFKVYIQPNPASTPNYGTIQVRNVEVRRVSSAVLIEDGAITADKISAGAITADKIHVTDLSTLNATIGGFTIDSTKIIGGDATSGVFAMQIPNDSDYVISIGGKSHSNYDDCPFRVTKSGKLYATNAEITGKVMATSWLGFKGYVCCYDMVKPNQYYGVVGMSIDTNNYRKINFGFVNCPSSNSPNLYGNNISVEQIDAAGNCRFFTRLTAVFNDTVTAKSYATSSDRRYKKDICNVDEKLVNAWNKINVQIFKYNYNDSLVNIGVIAQDVIAAFEAEELDWKSYNVVSETYDSEAGENRYSVCYEGLNMLTMAKTKQQDEEIANLKNEISELRTLLCANGIQ